MPQNRIAGTAFVKVTTPGGEDQQLQLRGSWTVNIDNFTREGMAGLDGVHGYKEMPMVPFMEGEFTMAPSLSLEALAAIEDATVTTTLANGNSYALHHAWTANSREVDADEGKCTIRFEGRYGFELLRST